MDSEILRSFFAYNNWANARLLAAVERLEKDAPAKLLERYGASFETISGTVAHILQGEYAYSTRWLGIERPPMPTEADSLADLRERWDRHTALINAYLQGSTDDALAAKVDTRRYDVGWQIPVWQLMLALINHGTHHRSELADMLTRAGEPPPPIDVADYYAELQGATITVAGH